MLLRNAAAKINALLEIFPAVLILGVRQCGKTTLARQVREDWKYFDCENSNDLDFITSDMDFFFNEYPSEIIVDEAQEFPDLFRHLRGVIDSNRDQKNRFILTGSSSPELIRPASESQAGRLGIVELGTIINKAQLARSLDTSEITIRDYIEIADKTFVWRMIPSYEKTISKSVVKMPKGILRDSGLAHFLANIDSREKLIRAPQVGQNFESFIIEEIIKGISCTEATNWRYYYYRTKHGAEVDLVLDGSFGVLPIEIKFGITTRSDQLTSLKRFLVDNSLPVGIVINNSTEVKLLTNNIIQIPATLI